ncbi:MAG: hypothetical protein IKE10_01565 [Bacilli bacterium]|nr:hypothetical protein [Bacilli bacterium]
MNMVKKIYDLKNSEIDSFIKKRLSELSNNESVTVGINSDNYMYSGFFDENVRINTTMRVKGKGSKTVLKLGGICINDINIYKYLVCACKIVNNPYLAVSMALDKYLYLSDPVRDRLGSEGIEFYRSRIMNFFLGKNKCAPINLLRKTKVSLCSEISAVAQNMFRFLDIESDFVTGISDDIHHAYNIVYPRGRQKDAILFEGNHAVDSDPLFFYLDQKKKTKLYMGEPVEFTEEDHYKGFKYLFGERIESYEPFKLSYRIHKVTFVPGGYEYSNVQDMNKGKLIFRNYYKGKQKIEKK